MGEKQNAKKFVRYSAQCFILFGFGQGFSFLCIPKQKLLYIVHKSIAMKYLTMFKKIKNILTKNLHLICVIWRGWGGDHILEQFEYFNYLNI